MMVFPKIPEWAIFLYNFLYAFAVTIPNPFSVPLRLCGCRTEKHQELKKMLDSIGLLFSNVVAEQTDGDVLEQVKWEWTKSWRQIF